MSKKKKTLKFDKNRMFEAESALQKEIRRGNERKAMYWALELEELNSSLLWNRLRVIASEDIGIANSTMALLIDTLHQWYKDFKKLEKDKEKDEKRLFLAHAILALCRSPKSRVACEFLRVVCGDKEKLKGKKLPVPDYALDGHTARGKAKGRGLDTEEGMKFFLDVGAKLKNEKTGSEFTKYKEQARELWLDEARQKEEKTKKEKGKS